MSSGAPRRPAEHKEASPLHALNTLLFSSCFVRSLNQPETHHDHLVATSDEPSGTQTISGPVETLFLNSPQCRDSPSRITLGEKIKPLDSLRFYPCSPTLRRPAEARAPKDSSKQPGDGPATSYQCPDSATQRAEAPAWG